MNHSVPIGRRPFLQLAAGGLASAVIASAAPAEEKAAPKKAVDERTSESAAKKPTQFQIACMTLPYNQFPLERALAGIAGAGFKHVAWGTTHRNAGENRGEPVIPADAPMEKAKQLGERCRDLGLAPVMMFSGIYPEAPNGLAVLTHRIKQAAAAGIPQVLTFGHTSGNNRQVWIERFKQLGPIARDHGVLLVVKQHGETGQVTGEIVREVADPGIMANYDAGNVMDYTKGKVNPLEDLVTCVGQVRSFCIKDHRMVPVNQDCGPGLGEIDHYRLLGLVAHTGLTMPLACENISAPKIKATKPEEIDALARRAREFLELVIQGLQA